MLVYLLFSGYAIHQNSQREHLIAAIWWHIGISLLAIIPIIAYAIVWLSARPINLSEQPVFLSWLVRTIALLFALLSISGILTVWARGSPLKIFDWVSVASPVDKMPQAYELMELLHRLFGFAALVSMALLVIVQVIAFFPSWSKSLNRPD